MKIAPLHGCLHAIILLGLFVGGIFSISWIGGRIWDRIWPAPPPPTPLSITEQERKISNGLKERISARDGVVYVTQPDGVYAYSLPAPWAVECDSTGLKIVFRHPADQEDAGIEVALLDDGQDNAACRILVPSTTQQFQRMMGGAT